MRDYQESVTTGQTGTGQSDPHVPLCFASDKKIMFYLTFNVANLKMFNQWICAWDELEYVPFISKFSGYYTKVRLRDNDLIFYYTFTLMKQIHILIVVQIDCGQHAAVTEWPGQSQGRIWFHQAVLKF